LFEPFFSTKSARGTGLGLWISRGIIQKYDGEITFRSIRLCGKNVTCFAVFVPTTATSYDAEKNNKAGLEAMSLAQR